MTLCDAGPLFALIDPRQIKAHARCKATLGVLPAPLITTWPSFTEAMFLTFRSGGWPMQDLLWRYVHQGALILHGSGQAEVERMKNLMERYRDTPMDLADASLVAAAEALGLSRVFSLDHHFRIYRIHGDQAFDVVP